MPGRFGNDFLSPAARSSRMAKVRSTGNRSTELAVENAFREAKIRGWTKHPNGMFGKPDFYFKKIKLALFVHGCFWHGCQRCDRRMPVARRRFWRRKIEGNRKRDLRVRRELRGQGVHAMVIWEHELGAKNWLNRIRAAVARLAGERPEAKENGRGGRNREIFKKIKK